MQRTKKKRFDVILLPEVALAGDAHEPFVLSNEIKNLSQKVNKKTFSHIDLAHILANKYQSEVIIGLIDREGEKSFNSAFFIQPFQAKEERYDKRVLVPLAEYLPVPFLESFLLKYGISSFFTAGKEAKVFKGKMPISVSICYEERLWAFDSRREKKRGFAFC